MFFHDFLIFLRDLWVRGRIVVTGLYLSRLTLLCTVHALCVATLVRAIVLQVFLVAHECGFRLPIDHTSSPSLSRDLELATFLVEFAVLDHSGHSFYIVLVFPQGSQDSVYHSICSPRTVGNYASSCFPTVQRTASHSFSVTAELASVTRRPRTYLVLALRQYVVPAPAEYASPASVVKYIALTQAFFRCASTGTGVLGASACSRCCTCCYSKRWLRFSPCRAHRLHLHLW